MWTEASAVVTAAVIAASVWYLLARKTFRRAPRANLIAVLLVLSAIAAVAAFLLFNALVHGDAYGMGARDTGRRYPAAGEPVTYWILAVIYYCAAVAATVFGMVAAIRLAQASR